MRNRVLFIRKQQRFKVVEFYDGHPQDSLIVSFERGFKMMTELKQQGYTEVPQSDYEYVKG